MEFNVIFSLPILAAYLRYPQIEGLGDELVPEGPWMQLVRKRKDAALKTSGSQLLEAKRLKLSSLQRSELTVKVTGQIAFEASEAEASELLTQPTLHLSLSKETAFPRKSRYDKGKSKVSHNLLEGPTAVGPLGLVWVIDKGEKMTILDLLVGARPSREVSIPFEESGPLVSEPLPVTSLPQTSSAIIPLEPRVVGETLGPNHDELEDVEPFAVEEMDRSGTFLS
jgi:hypothetical protein